ncbi:MAG: hypothetical protein V3W34_06930 [Phycisphaerae bacterium]
MSEQNEHHPAEHGGSSALRTELLEHAPFSVSSVAIGLVFAGLLCYIAPVSQELVPSGQDHAGHSGYHLFHLFHPVHMFFSAAATTAMFWRYDHRVFKAVLVGLTGAIVVCGVSDILLPHFSLIFMGRRAPLHICVVENPELVLPFAVMGMLVGLGAAGTVAGSTLFSHSLHVLASTMASIFYLIAPFGRVEWFSNAGRIFIFVTIAVMVPCCLSDIVFPLLMTKQARAKALAAAHGH